MRKAIFLDRDGVINEDISPYVRHRSQLKLFPWAADSLVRLNEAGFDIYVISNQQGVALGITPQEELNACSEVINSAVRDSGFQIKKFFYCTAKDADNHPWRKPSPGMIVSAGEEFGFDPSGSFIIGDKWSDIEAAARAGCKGLLVLTGVTPDDERWKSWEFPPVQVFKLLKEAVDFVIAESP